MFYVYILKSKRNGSYYIGSCENVAIRIKKHNSGLVRSTKRYMPWNLVHVENYQDLKSARQRELQIKSWKKRHAIEVLIKSRNGKIL